MKKHLIFYDGDCAFCHKAVLQIIKEDEKTLFLFSSLEGETAQEILVGPKARYAKEDSLVLVESFRSDRRRFWLRSKAVFRIYWLMGSYWIGWLCFLPAWIGDWAYRLISKHRHRLHFGWERPEFQSDRFLP